MKKEIKQYRKKPIIIEAIQWSGLEKDLPKIFALAPKDKDGKFDLPSDGISVESGIGYTPPTGELMIPTLEGVMTAQPDDWIIKGVKGEIYPCKPDIFKQTYDEVTCK